MQTENHQKYLFHSIKEDTFQNQTYSDLNLEEVFEQIDQTHSAYGKQYFYKYLFDSNANFSPDVINKDVNAINESSKNKEKWIQLLSKNNQFKDSFLIDLLFNSFKMSRSFQLLSFIPFILYTIGVVGLFMHNKLIIATIVGLCINVYFYAWSKRQILYSIYGLSALKGFLKLNKRITKDAPQLSGATTIKPIKPLRIQFYLTLVNLQFGKDGLDIIITSIVEIIKCILNLEFFAYLICSKKINKHREQLLQIYQRLGYLDMLLSISELKKLSGTCCPVFTNDIEKLEIIDGHHPLVVDCIKNTFIPVLKNSLITGANMSGKSIFLKQVALNIYLGQKLNICFARMAIIPNCPVYTYLTISDDILNGKSYYYRELERIKEILSYAQSKNGVVVIDEIFKGTNRNEQIAMGYSVLNGISETGSMVVASTHDINLLNMLTGFNNYYFEMVNINGEYLFNYKIQEGKNMPINAITLAKHIGLPDSIIKNAEKAFESIAN